MVQIHFNQAGLEEFIETLKSFLDVKGHEHFHLMTPDWGGETLTSEKQGLENRLIHHVKVYKWSEE